MIPTRHILFDGVMLEVPLIGGYAMEFAADTVEDYPSYCGPGPGIGDKLTPERAYGTRLSVACHIHDVMRAVALTTEEEFCQHNIVFFRNMINLIIARETDDHDRVGALHQAALYYGAVQIWGRRAFFKKDRKEIA